MKEKLPALYNEAYLAELGYLESATRTTDSESKSISGCMHLIMQAYVAAWQGGYNWEFEIFIREKIIGAGFHIDPDILVQFKAKMAQQICPESGIQTSN